MKASKIISIIGSALLASVAIGGTVTAHQFDGVIDGFLDQTDRNFGGEAFKEAAAESDKLCQRLAEDGVALLRNERSTLPYKNKKVNVFGWASTDNGFLLSGIGSGSSTIRDEAAVTLLQAFEKEGWQTNKELTKFYTDYDSTSFKGKFGTGNGSRIPLREPEITRYTEQLIQNALDFSDQAVVVLSRVCGENVGEVPIYSSTIGEETDSSRSYLHISKREEDMLRMVTEKFDKVTVIINSSNTMELGFLEDYDVGAALNVGLMGQSGALAIPRILDGTVNPSGRTTDTFAYNAGENTSDPDPLFAPSFVNYKETNWNIGYLEGVYVGYRFFETADVEGYWADLPNGYHDVVQYPFGHGLSYSKFEWTLQGIFDESDNATTLNPSDPNKLYTLKFACKNTGDVAGKDVMQVYGHVPYLAGQIEKSSVQLLDFCKTVTLNPGDTQSSGLECSFRFYDLASYDCYDKNTNGHMGYELDKGEYSITFNENSHDLKKMADNASASLKASLGDTVNIDKDPVTNQPVINRFTGKDAYGNCPIDGSNAFDSAPEQLTRKDGFWGWHDSVKHVAKANIGGSNVNGFTNDKFNQTTMPSTGVDVGWRIQDAEGKFDMELIDEIGDDYDAIALDELVDQITTSELKDLVLNAAFGTAALPSVGKPECADFDGPAGFNQNSMKAGFDNGQWTAFPCEVLIGQTWNKNLAYQMGTSAANEAKATNIQGWYAPGVNIHRTAFSGRNYEYYSEDPVLSGKMAAKVCLGAKNHGLYAYLKHFTLAEEGPNPRNINTWLSEQAYREIYLRPFEIAVKEGKTVGIMSGFNNIGSIWCGSCSAQNNDVLRGEWGFRGTVITDYYDGSEGMNPYRGIRAGNDIWLRGMGNFNLDMSDPTTVYCAKMAARNVLFTYLNTRYTAAHYDTANDEIQVNIGEVKIEKKVFPWRETLIAFDVAVGVGIVVWLGLVWVLPLFRKKA
ncbi:MAG: glycoside hydrolase family 3 C-terminal domain-containing protein [Bacilli bacterium]|nr:glycoside hydrolase family 3 C-terminal domain-containing protein [Bacilli bacterium]